MTFRLEHTVNPRMRTDRPGFIPKLYEASQAASELRFGAG